jgi:hypothetical protein
MRKIISLFTCLAAWGFTSTAALAAQASSDPPAARDGSHDMDFNFGTWHTDIARTPDPFGDPGNVMHISGTVTVKPIWNGKGELEEIEAEGPKGHWEVRTSSFTTPPPTNGFRLTSMPARAVSTSHPGLVNTGTATSNIILPTRFTDGQFSIVRSGPTSSQTPTPIPKAFPTTAGAPGVRHS